MRQWQTHTGQKKGAKRNGWLVNSHVGPSDPTGSQSGFLFPTTVERVVSGKPQLSTVGYSI